MTEEKNWKAIYKDSWISFGKFLITELNPKKWEEDAFLKIAVIIITAATIIFLLVGD